MKKKWRLKRAEGQSLVEMAMTLPLLLLMFVGLVEVGAALRNYLVLVNANREGTRFAARGRWINADAEVLTQEDAQDIFKWVIAAAGVDQRGRNLIPFLRTEPDGELSANTTIAVHYIEVPPQWNRGGWEETAPAIVHGPWYSGTLHFGETRINAQAVAEQARQSNYDFNKKYFVEQRILDVPSADNFVIVEVWFEHEQLLKLPIFTELLPEKFTLYAHTQMRISLGREFELQETE